MARRAAAERPPTRNGARPAVSPTATARRTSNCMSASGGTAHLMRGGSDRVCGDGIGAVSFPEQNLKGWNVVVPLDQGRLRAEPANRIGIEVPRLIGDDRTMSVDEHHLTWVRIVVLSAEPAQVQFADGFSREPVD